MILLALALFRPAKGGVGTGCVPGVDCAPPMGWRSWNAFGGAVFQGLMEEVMDVMTDPTVEGQGGKSFASVGYTDVVLDDNYQHCGAGVNGTFHAWDEASQAYVNVVQHATFPDLRAMTDHAHALNLTAGFYGAHVLYHLSRHAGV